MMAGNRKHGFMRGNANGRNGTNSQKRWYCGGCSREHGGRVDKTLMRGIDYCDRTYLAKKEHEWEVVRVLNVTSTFFGLSKSEV